MAEKATAEAGTYGQLMREFVAQKDGLPSSDVREVVVDAADRVWVLTRRGAASFDGKKWSAHKLPQEIVDPQGLGGPEAQGLAAVGETIWIGGAAGLCRWNGKAFEPVTDGPANPVSLLRGYQGKLFAASADHIGIHDGSAWQMVKYPQPFGVTDMLLDGDGVLWVATDAGLWRWDGSSWDGFAPGRAHAGPPAMGVSALALDARGTLWVGTNAGIGLFDREGWWEHVKGKDGLPYEQVTCIKIAPDGAVWTGFPIGCARLREGEWDYFANLRWLPHDEVRGIALRADGSAWVATHQGLSRIYEEPMTLARKAAYFEERIQKRHYRMGFVADIDLGAPGDVEDFTYEATDNDGLWTALYVGAECYRYAVTGEQEARDLARTSVYAMVDLEQKTTIPGFPARAIVKKGEPNTRKSGGEWHDSADGEWEWKADTSSDEIDGHFYAYALYYDLVADDAEKEDMRGVCRRIMDHIIDHGYLLVDLDGKQTTWGVWSPELLNGPWEAQRGLNSLEILSFLKTTYHVTGDEKYQEHYLGLALDHHFALNTLYQKVMYPSSVNHSDDELAIVVYDPLLRYETDPALRAIYVASLERTWQCERPEYSPFQNYIYGAVTGKFCDVEESLKTLRDIPWDTVQYRMKNSHRADLVADVRMGRFGEAQATTVIKPHERAMLKWNGNPYRMDDGRGGTGEDDGAFFLLPYWMGRYYGYVKE
ncbi:MAG: hypothetical protein JSV65_00335 [Armatimonadota bacterium]|nr:MAG: hypothetical protein JSV65_00335 [Armatimonadota bacterium]